MVLLPADDQQENIEIDSEKDKNLESGNAQSIDDVLAQHQLSTLQVHERSNLLVSGISIHHVETDDGVRELSPETPQGQQLPHPAETANNSCSGTGMETTASLWDQNGNLAMTLSRIDDLPHDCTNTLCPAELGILDHLDFGDIDVCGDFDAGEIDLLPPLVPNDLEIESAASIADGDRSFDGWTLARHVSTMTFYRDLIKIKSEIYDEEA